MYSLLWIREIDKAKSLCIGNKELREPSRELT